jgi:predicted PurR-regulated permease PerM
VFSLIGLRAPLLFALFCAITNVIPYAGPYIGAVPALIVGFATSPTIGLLTLIAIVIIQFFEGNFLQEMIMSKTTKLHPVTIISGLLIFGHFWGIFGMVISTPLLAVVKQIYLFLDEKYDFFKSDDEDDYEKKNKKDNNLIENKQELVEVK